jgi:fructuronate reductase
MRSTSSTPLSTRCRDGRSTCEGTISLNKLVRTAPTAPARIVHLGLGAFHRAHQAWYTHVATDSEQWGIAAFTGRSAELARRLRRQDCLYQLIIRANDADRIELVASIVDARAGSDFEAWTSALAAPSTAVVTLTVTESAYHHTGFGRLDVSARQIVADLEAFRIGHLDRATSVPARLVTGLAARRAAGSGAVTIVPCDNLPQNGAVARAVVTEFAALTDPSLVGWIEEYVSFVATTVDRITPATTPQVSATVAKLTGFDDLAPVVTEPFTEWILSGDFPVGRPSWETAGARFVADIEPFEQRKLWLLNGAHSLLAYAGSALGHRTVDEAIADPRCLTWVTHWWQLATGTLDLPESEIYQYQQALLGRFRNIRISHQLAQIAADGSQKLSVRVMPVIRERRAAGAELTAGARIVAAWIAHLRGSGAAIGVGVRDPDAGQLVHAAAGVWTDAVPAVLALLAPDLADDDGFRALVVLLGVDLERQAAARLG